MKNSQEDEHEKLLKEKDLKLKLLNSENGRLHKKIARLETDIITLKNELNASKNEINRLAKIKIVEPKIYLPYNGSGPLPTHISLPGGKTKKIKLFD